MIKVPGHWDTFGVKPTFESECVEAPLAGKTLTQEELEKKTDQQDGGPRESVVERGA